MLAPVIIGHIDNFEAGERRRRFEQGRPKARAKEQELLERVRGQRIRLNGTDGSIETLADR